MTKAQHFKDMPMDKYQAAHDYISKSMLGVLADCPARFKHQFIDGNQPEQTKSLRLGHAVHTMALEPELFKQTYHVLPATYFNDKGEEKPFRMDERLAVYKEQVEIANGRTLIKADEIEQIERMCEALTKNKFALSLLKAAGYVESSIFWEDAAGNKFRCRPDFMRNDGLIVDIKTCRSAKPSVFANDAANLHYDVSVALTCRGYEALYGKPADNYVFLCIEPEAPHIIECYDAFRPFDFVGGMSYLDIGNSRLDKLVQQYNECMAANIWPSYNEKIEPMRAPNWLVNQIIGE